MGEESRASAGEVLQLGPGPPRGGRSRWGIVALCCLVLAAGAGLWLHGERDGPSGSPPTPSAEEPSIEHLPGETVPPRDETEIGLSFLHATSGYALFVRSESGVYRAMPRSGRLIRTAVSASSEHGGTPGFLVPVTDAVVAGGVGGSMPVIVPDDGLGQEFVRTGAVLPGPDRRHVWVERSDSTLALVGADGEMMSGTTLEIPDGISGPVRPDGQGFVLVRTSNGVYDLRPGSVRLVTKAAVLATGPDRLLVRRCSGPGDSCRIMLLDGALHPIRTIDGLDIGGMGMPHGVISPDHRTVAFSSGNDNAVQLIDLATGSVRDIGVRTVWWVIFAPGSVLAFSPDSRWLFVIDDEQHVEAVDVAAGATRRILPDAFPAQQLAVRP